MNEFAPEYSKREKLLFMIKHIAWTIPFIAAVNYAFFPWLRKYAANSHCYKYGEITGTEVIFYGLFVALPLVSAFLLLLFEGNRCIKIIQLGQSPLPGEKVFKPTKYTYGIRVKLKPYCFFLIVIVLLGLSINGIFSANQLIGKVNSNELPKCDIN